MTDQVGGPDLPCANCGRSFPVADLDSRAWCHDCRTRLVRRSAVTARLVAFAVTLALAYWIFANVADRSRFLVAFIVLIVATYFLLVKIGQRVAFELMRGRGVPPPAPPR